MSLQDKLTSQSNYTQYSTQEVSIFQGYTKDLQLTIPTEYTDGTYVLRVIIKTGNIENFSPTSADIVNFDTTITAIDTTIKLLSGHTVNIPVGDAVMDLVIIKGSDILSYGRYSITCLKPNYDTGSSPIPPSSAITEGQLLYKNGLGDIVGIGTASGTAISISNKPADKAYADTKVSKSGDTINGVFQNSTTPKTQIILNGTNAGDNADGTPNINSSPRVELSTYQYSDYASGEAQKGGFSELVRLVSKDTQAKPTLAYYDHNYYPVAWLVAHFQPQDLRIYANLAAFPATGVDDGLRAYFAQDTGLYYTWNGSAYVELTTTNAEYYFRAIHQHFSIETADTTGYANYTRLAIPYDLDVVPITTTNSHFRITGGSKSGKPFGAFVVDEGKMFSLNPIILYPNSSNAATVETWKDSATDNIFANNTKGLRLRVLASGNAENLVSGQDVVAMNAEGANFLEVNENLIVGGSSDFSLGINRAPGVTLDVRRNLGNANNTEYNVARISRDEDSFLNLGYRGNGTGVGAYMVRATGSKDVILGTTTDPVALTVGGGTGNVEINKRIYSNTVQPGVGLINGRISVTVASNNLTVSIVGNDGNAPSATNKVDVWIPDANGTLTRRSITGALSVTANAGTNWFNSGSTERATYGVDYFVYVGFNATDGVTVGFSPLPGVNRYDGFNTTSTNAKYARISTITNASASDGYVNVGRFRATLSGGAGYTWTVPSFSSNTLIQRPIFETAILSTSNSTYTISNRTLTINRDVASILIDDAEGSETTTAITYGFTYASNPNIMATIYAENYGYFCSVYFLSKSTTGGNILVMRNSLQSGGVEGERSVGVSLHITGEYY